LVVKEIAGPAYRKSWDDYVDRNGKYKWRMMAWNWESTREIIKAGKGDSQ
jgi:hypothetical protein